MRGRKSKRRWWLVVGGVVLLLILAGLVGIGGCGSETASETKDDGLSSEPGFVGALPPAEEQTGGAGRDSATVVPTTVWTGSTAPGSTGTGSLTAWERAAAQKIISDAQLEVEVEKGQFEAVFAQALLLADRYGGYVVSSSSSAGGEEDTMRSGVIALRIPAASFDRALADAAGLGTLKNRRIQTQDVTEEYVDLQARIVNAEAQVKALRELLARATTVDEILQVQQYLAMAQGDLESLKGRLRYLEEHTAYSTITLTLYESGVTVTPPGEWGLIKALDDALHNLVDAVNAIIRGLGVLIPVLVVLAIIGLVIYLVWRAAARRRRTKRGQYPGPYGPYPQSWGGSAPTVSAGPGMQPQEQTGSPSAFQAGAGGTSDQ